MQRTSSELRISDWSSDVCSSDLLHLRSLRERSIRGTKIDHEHFVVQFGLERHPHRCVRRLPRERHHIVNDTLKPLLNGDCKRPLLGEIQASDIPKLNLQPDPGLRAGNGHADQQACCQQCAMEPKLPYRWCATALMQSFV